MSITERLRDKIKVVADADSPASEAAKLIAGEARAALRKHGSFVMVVSGGHSPWLMLRVLALEDLPWNAVHIVRVEERIALAGDPDGNLTHLQERSGSEKTEILARLVARDLIPASQVRDDHAIVIADRAALGRLGNDLKAEVA